MPSEYKENYERIRSPSPLSRGINHLNIAPVARKRSSSIRNTNEIYEDRDEMRPRTFSNSTYALRRPRLHNTNLRLNIQPDTEEYTI